MTQNKTGNIRVRDISGGQGIAIGSGASASVTVKTMPAGSNDDKKELEALIAKLNDVLKQVPPANADDVETVAQIAETLVQVASKEKPNRGMLRITGEGLKQAAKDLEAIAPMVVGIAAEIVGLIGRMINQ